MTCTQPKPEICGKTDENGLPYHLECPKVPSQILEFVKIQDQQFECTTAPSGESEEAYGLTFHYFHETNTSTGYSFAVALDTVTGEIVTADDCYEILEFPEADLVRSTVVDGQIV